MTLTTREIQKDTRVEFMSPELLFLATSGQPYRGSIYVNFVSQGISFDLQDFKKYITTLRSVTLNAEDIAYEIHKTINASLKNDSLGVSVDLSSRGGIQQRISYGKQFEVVAKPTMFQL